MSTTTCLILGGTGTLAATAEDLARSGADVLVAARRPELAPAAWEGLGIRTMRADREDTAALDALVGDGVDALIDGQCYSPAHAEDLARWSRRCGASVMLSARAVYVDDRGRHANSEEPPQWPGPTPESTATMAYTGEPFASRLGYGSNKAESERVLAARGERVSVLRPARIHGRSTRRVREWPLVRAVLDGARRIEVDGADISGSLTSTTVIARAALACLDVPGSRVLNVADAPGLTNLEAARALVAALDGEVRVGACEDGSGGGATAAATGRAVVVPGAWASGQELSLAALAALIGEVPGARETLVRTAQWVRGLARRAGDGTWELPEQFDGS